MHSILAIGGSDNSGGAGIQADIKALNSINVHCFTVLTCITSQNSKRVFSIYKLPIKEIEIQIDTLMQNFPLKIVKTGMLYDEEIVKLVARKIRQYNLIAIVDPVMKASVGDKLIKENFLNSLKEEIFPKTFLLTPNIYEASKILSKRIKTKEEMKKASKEIFNLGVKNVLIKGGHLKKIAEDILYNGRYEFFSSKKLNRKLHGTGCSFSSLIAGNLAKGKSLRESISLAKESITMMIENSYNLGNFDFLDSNATLQKNAEKYLVLKEVKEGAKELEKILPLNFVPEVGINICFALKNAKMHEDVCGIEGRIVKVGKEVKVIGVPEFNVSKHVATVVLTVMKYDKEKRCAMNIKYSEEILQKVKRAKLKISCFDRKKEPKNISTMAWGTKTAIKKFGLMDIIYDLGKEGKEAMIRIIGNNPKDVLEKLKKIVRS